LAVTTADWAALTGIADAVNPEVICPAVSVTVDGTAKFVLSLESTTTNPPVGAAPLRDIVHSVLPGVLIDLRAQLNPLSETCALEREIVPEPPLAGMELPAAVAATTPEIWMGIDAVDGFDATWNVATATVPSGIVVAFIPKSTQLFPEHVMLLPALTADGPAVTVTLVTSEE
jgi:hypothetical protein